MSLAQQARSHLLCRQNVTPSPPGSVEHVLLDAVSESWSILILSDCKISKLASWSALLTEELDGRHEDLYVK